MTQNRKINKAAVWLAVGMLLCFCLCQYGLMGIFGFSIFPDEFGYWAPAASLLGWDWSETASIGSYYSFGYSLILTPILALFEDSIAAYRAAVVVNMILMCVAMYLLYWLAVKLFPELEKEKAAVISSIAVLYPPWIFYMQMTMTEGLLLFMYICVCVLFYRFLEKPGALTGILLAVALIYIYLVHMRSVGLLAAAGFTLLLWGVGSRNKAVRRKVLLTLVLLAILFAIALVIKENLIEKIYHAATEETIQANDFSGQWGKLSRVFSIQGLTDLVLGFSAKLLYLGIATFGLGYRGLWLIGNKALGVIRSWNRPERERTELIWCFLLLASVGQILVTLIYTIGVTNRSGGRFDLFVHGRYNELIVPILLVLGLIQMLQSRRIWVETAGIAGICGVFTLIAAQIAERMNMGNVHGYFMIGMSYLLKEENFQAENFLWLTLGLGCMLMLISTGVVWFYKHYFHREWLLTVLILIQVMCGLQASEHYVYIGNSYGYGDVRMADKLWQVIEETGEAESGTQNATVEAADGQTAGRIIYIYEGGNPYIDQVQFRMRDTSIEVWNAETEKLSKEDMEELRPEDKLMIGENSIYREELENRYGQMWQSGHLSLFYNG